jgi:hypothetical protein
LNSSDLGDLRALARGESGDGASSADTDEEQSGLVTLLLQMPLAELREIARQRSWRVKATSKADYVPALASLLSDPTETARAVTGLPENLREALRAAFVADDGSGITATIMAQTMTALRGAAGPTIKPVEAAALLSDLARWGLVLQWRDSLYGEGRHVLPWQVQRLVPPLPGWCPPSREAPPAPTRCRDAGQAVRSLCAVWKSIATVQPAVRRPLAPQSDGAAERLGERRFSSMVQGWPYDPQELRDWVTNHRRADTAVQTLAVPPTPFLVEDADLARLARLIEDHGSAAPEGDGQSLTEGDGERLEFLCRVLCELDLIKVQNGHLTGQSEQMARFLQLSVPDQHRTIAQAYLSLLDWSELDLLLREDTRLMLWRKPYFSTPYDQFRSVLVQLRHMLLRFLACAGEDAWCRFSDIEVALRKLWPHFAAPLQSERQSWLSQAWGLAWHPELREPEMAEPPPRRDAESEPQSRLANPATLLAARSVVPPRARAVSPRSGRETRPAGTRRPRQAAASGLNEDAVAIAENAGLSGDAPGAWHHPGERIAADWAASQGAFLRVMLEGPLCWLGFAEVSQSGGQPAVFRLRGLANWIWDRPAARFDVELESPPEALAIDEEGGTISMPPESVPPQAHMFLGRIARLEEASPERFLYRLHPQTALATFESGASLSDLVAEWERVMSQPIPATVREMLNQFWTRYGQVRVYEGFTLLELNDPVTLRELEAGTSLSQHIVGRLSPRLVLVPDAAVEALMREFAAKDYMPKEVE